MNCPADATIQSLQEQGEQTEIGTRPSGPRAGGGQIVDSGEVLTFPAIGQQDP